MIFGSIFKVEDPTCLSEEQLNWWRTHLVPMLHMAEEVRLSKTDRLNQIKVYLQFPQDCSDYAHSVACKFVTELLMDPVTKQVGPMADSANYGVITSLLGNYRFYIGASEQPCADAISFDPFRRVTDVDRKTKITLTLLEI